MRIILFRKTDGEILDVHAWNANHDGHNIRKEILEIADAQQQIGVGVIEIGDNIRPNTHRVEQSTDGLSLRIVPKDAPGDEGKKWFMQTAKERHDQRVRREVLRNRGDGSMALFEDVTERDVPSGTFTGEDAADVSVIVTCHNYEEFLEECLASIVAQQPPPRQIIVIHDACESLSPSIIGIKNLPFSLYTSDFKNAALARNFGAAKATGSLLLFVDADDKLAPDFTKALAAGLFDPRVAFAYPTVQHYGTVSARMNARTFNREQLFEENIVPISALVRRDVFEEVGGFDGGLTCYRDWDLWQRIVKRHYRGRPCPDAVLYYRHHERNLSKAHSPEAANAVIQKNADVLIVTAFDNKDWCIEEHVESIRQFDFDRRRLHLLFIDNSNDPAISARLRSSLSDLSDSSDLSDVRLLDRSDLAPLDRSIQAYNLAVSRRMVQLYRSIPFETDCEFVLIYENDVIAPPDTLKFLLSAAGLRVGAVTACCHAKPGDGITPGLQAWRYTSFRPPALNFHDRVSAEGRTEPFAIGTSAFSCVLIRTAAWRHVLLRATKPILAYDGIFGHDLGVFGYRYLLHPGVQCKHMISPGEYV